MLNIAICDDDEYICSIIEGIIIDFKKKSEIEIRVEVFYSGEKLIEYLKNEDKFDLIFLDIELGNTTGIEVASHIRNKFDDHISKIVFITSKDGYEQELFEVQPLNFIKKPIDSRSLKKCIQLAIKLLKIENKSFRYKKDNNIIRVDIKNTLYFESKGKKIKIVTYSGSDFFYETMKDIKEELPKVFIKPHASFIINFNKVKALKSKLVLMENGIEIPISRRRLKNMRNMLIKLEQEKRNARV
jgi:DNA-binding LytR/AlgR family response regulator